MQRLTHQLDGRPDRFGRFCKGMGIVGVVAALAAPALAAAADPPKRPNIVVILGDDMGFSDMGSFGSEIKTPNLDSLAREGVRFTNFYTHASCSPSRSMLLSGVDTHLNGLGNMSEWTAPNQMGRDGYEGNLNDRVVTLPQLLKDAGYHTYMVGKWHLGKEPTQIPAARGFERDFTLLDGMGSYWDDTNFSALTPKSLYTEDGKYLRSLPKNSWPTRRRTIPTTCRRSGARATSASTTRAGTRSGRSGSSGRSNSASCRRAPSSPSACGSCPIRSCSRR